MTKRQELEKLCDELEQIAQDRLHPCCATVEVAQALSVLGRGTPHAELGRRIAEAWRKINDFE